MASAKISFFFCSFSDQESQDTRNLLGSLLVQMCESNEELWAILDELYHKAKDHPEREPKKPDDYELADLVVQFCERIEGAFVIVDALNESKQSSKMFDTLLRMTPKSRYLRLLISSTEELSLEQRPLPITIVAMRKTETTKDIVDYIDKRLQNDDKLCTLPKVLKDDIKVVLQDKAGQYSCQVLPDLYFASFRACTKRMFDLTKHA